MPPMCGEALTVCLQALDRGIVPPERHERVRAAIESFPSERTDPGALVERGVLTAEELDRARAEATGAETAPMPRPDAEPGPSPAAPTGFPRSFGDDYELLGELGKGGMGQVFNAWQRSLRRHVALKVMRPTAALDLELVQRFQGEARAAARLVHPHIVSVHEVGAHRGEYFFTMDLVDGPPLSDVIRQGTLPLGDALALIEKVARALHYAHEQGIIHRDLKPGNILVDRRGEPRVTDFGLAKDMETEFSLSISRAVMGTPSYMSPEQARGLSRFADARSDVYSLGAVLYEMLTGGPPFQAETSYELLRKVVEDDPVPLRRLKGTVPADVETICLKCLRKEPSRRYQTAKELADDLRRFLNDEPIAARPSSVFYRVRKSLRRHRTPTAVAAGALVVIAALVAALAVLSRNRAPRPGSAHSAKVDAQTGVMAFDAAGQIAWRRELATAVNVAQALTDRTGRRRILAGLGGTGPGAGDVVAFDEQGNEAWRLPAATRTPYTGDSFVSMQTTTLLVEDLLPEPGTEIVAISISRWYPSRACILSEDGAVLREMWHPGHLAGALRLKGTRRLVFWACNNSLTRTRLGDRSATLFYVVFCVEAEKANGLCPPYTVEGRPRTEAAWYKAILPQGRAWDRVTGEVTLGISGARLEVWTDKGWILYLDAEGNLINRVAGTSRQDPPSDLADVLASLRRP